MEPARRVKPENFNDPPSSGQVYYYIHRAREAGDEFALVPVRKGYAAVGISKMKVNKQSYRQAIKNLRVTIAMGRSNGREECEQDKKRS